MGHPIDVDHEVAADPHKVFLGQLQQQVFEAGLDIVLPLTNVDGAVFAFHLNESNITEVNAAELVAHLGEEVLRTKARRVSGFEGLRDGFFEICGGILDFSIGQSQFVIENGQFVLRAELLHKFVQAVFPAGDQHQVRGREQADARSFCCFARRAHVTTQLFEVLLRCGGGTVAAEDEDAGFTYHVKRRTYWGSVCSSMAILGFKTPELGYVNQNEGTACLACDA